MKIADCRIRCGKQSFISIPLSLLAGKWIQFKQQIFPLQKIQLFPVSQLYFHCTAHLCVNFCSTENISTAKNTTFHWPQFPIYRNFVIQFYYTFTVHQLYIFAVHNIKENSILPVQRKKQMTQAIRWVSSTPFGIPFRLPVQL